MERSVSLSWTQKLQLLRGVLGGERAFAGPFTVLLDITSRCNLSCVGCRYHSPEIDLPSLSDPAIRDVPLELVERLCSEFPELGTRAVMLISEGESLLHPQVYEIIRLCKASGARVTLFTNGTLLTEDRRTALIRSGLDTLKISYWGTGPDEWARNYPGTDPDLLRRVAGHVRLMNKSKQAADSPRPRTILHYVINRNSYRKLREAVEVAADILCDGISFSVFKPRRGLLDCHALTAPEEGIVIKELQTLRPILQDYSLAHNLDDVLLRYRIGGKCWLKLPCYIGWLDARVKMDGTVQPCAPCSLQLGSLQGTSLREIWNGPAFRNFRKAASSRRSLAGLQENCDCIYCCHVPTNQLMYRYAGWLRGKHS
jgi:MoaA/NifB/PqqE/SkfB family radical SAM enzyme